MTAPKRKKTGTADMPKPPPRREIPSTPLPPPSNPATSSRVGPGSVAAPPTEEKEKSKIQRQSYSCAECKRLKLKCSRAWPCTSCEKRGCAQVCPNGTIRTGKGKRLILADTEELHQRISSLELALAQSQSQLTTEPHPLLSSSYGYSPRDVAAARPTLLTSEDDALIAKQEVLTPATGSRVIDAGDGDVVDGAFGTLTLGRGGHASFIGSFAGSEYLQPGTGARQGGRAGRGGAGGLNTPPPTAAVPAGFDLRLITARSGPPAPGFRIGGYPDDRDVDIDELRRELPDWEREGRELVSGYWENVSLMHQIVPRHIFESQYLQQAYTANVGVHPHTLAVVFLVMACGVVFDLHRPPFDERGAELFALGQACLSAIGLEHATLATIRALHLSGTLVLNDQHGSGAEIFWPVLGTAIKVAYSLGIHRDGAVFGLSPEETEERRLVWWELVSYARLQAVCFARPAGIAGRDSDTKMPEAHESDSDNYQHTKYRLVELMEKVNNAQTQVAPVAYSLVKALDAELVEFKKTFPDTLLPLSSMSTLPSDSTVPPHLVFHRLTIRLLLAQNRLLLARPFFAKALAENPEDPSFCQHGESFEALFEAAQEIVQVVQHLVVYHPSLVARWWFYWFHAFSSACCFAAIAIRAPKSAFAAPAYDGLIIVFDLASAAPPGCRAKKGLPVLLRLQARAQDSMRKAGRQGAINASFLPNRPGRLAPYIPSPEAVRRTKAGEGEDDDLGHLTGKSKLKRVKESHIRSNGQAGDSPGSAGGAEGQGYAVPMGQQYAYSPAGHYVAPGAVPFVGGGRSRAGTGTFQDFMVSPSSVMSAATSMTLADRAWEGVVPPPPPSAPMPYSDLGMMAGTAGLMGDGMAAPSWSIYNYAPTIAGNFPTLLSNAPYPHPYLQGDGNLSSSHSQPVWSPPATSSSGLSGNYYPSTINPSAAGGGGSSAYTFAQGSSSGMGNGYEHLVDGQGQGQAEFELGLDLDMSMALGFGEGTAGGGGAGEWDWENLINGTGGYA